jgi:hypothetical protein
MTSFAEQPNISFAQPGTEPVRIFNRPLAQISSNSELVLAGGFQFCITNEQAGTVHRK